LFKLRITREINASKEFIFDWWTDLSPDDSRLVKPLKSRKIISKSPNLIVLEDEERMYFRRMKFSVRVSMERPNRWVSEYEGKTAHARSEYVLSSISKEVTRLHYTSEISPEGFFTNLFSPIIKLFVKRVFQGEFDVFIRAIESEYARKSC